MGISHKIFFFLRWSFYRGGPMQSFVNSVTGTFGCLYMQPIILSFLWGSMISGKVHFIFLSLCSFRTFGVLCFNLLSIYIKVQYFEAVVNISGQYLIKRFYLLLVYTQWFHFGLVLTIYYQILQMIKVIWKSRNIHMEAQIGSS